MGEGIGLGLRDGRGQGRAMGGSVALALLLLLGTGLPAEAQIGAYSRLPHGVPTTEQPKPDPAPTPSPTPQAAPEPFPRLEIGALFCKSKDDLLKFQTKVAGGASAAVAGQALDCHVMRKQTGIKILDHDGPSRTEVVTTDAAKETGWTNAYVPTATPPVARGEDSDDQQNGSSLYHSLPDIH